MGADDGVAPWLDHAPPRPPAKTAERAHMDAAEAPSRQEAGRARGESSRLLTPRTVVPGGV